jgi:AraC-like DNA-binding protein
MNFSYELANIFSNKKEMFSKPKISRKEELLEKFLKLLFESFKEKHIVTFYAEKLCITPQYLSLILKELTGKSANKWIDDVLIVEAKIRLKAPDATVQQVADELCFSDQSTFGKFFKKHIGISPMEYRKS